MSLVGERVHIHAGDSLAYLKSLADRPPGGLEFLDLLYLDSFECRIIFGERQTTLTAY